MFSALFIAIAAADVALLVWALLIARRTPGPAIVLVLTNLAFLWADALIIGSGRWIGPGALLEGLTRFRFSIHYLVLPVMIIAAGSIARLAGLNWARPRWAMGLICLVAVVFILRDLPHLFEKTYVEACFKDTFRYVQAVAPAELCRPDQAMGARGRFPVAAVVSVIAMLIVGISIGLRHRWWALAAGSAVMFVLAALPASKVGPWPSSVGEVIFLGVILATIVRLNRKTVS